MVNDYIIKAWQHQLETNYNQGDLPEPVGSRHWDADEETSSLVLPNGVILQDGHELFFDVINQTGSTLANGKVAAFAGSVGASGKIKAQYGIANYDIMLPKYMIGIVTQDILNGNQGKITWFGKVRGIQTDGANYGETWVDGDILYVSTIVAGAMTKVQPQAPYPAIPIAAVVKAHATMGTIIVRPTFPLRMIDLADVNGTPLISSGQFGVWDNDLKVFDFTENINNYKHSVYCPATLTVNTGTLIQGTVADLCAIGGTDVIVNELTGTDPLRVTIGFTGVERLTSFAFYGRYSGGASHVIWIEAYNYNTASWQLLGELGYSSVKQWYSYNIFLPTNYVDSGNVQIRFNHQGNGINTHQLILDYVDVNYGGAGGASFQTASEVAFVPSGNIASSNVQAAIQELDNEKVSVGGIEDISFEFADVVAGTAKDYTLDIKASFGYTIESACLETDNGTLTGVAVKINSTAVTSLSSLTVDTAVDETASTGAKTVAIGDRVWLSISTGYTGTPTLIRGKLKIKRT